MSYCGPQWISDYSFTNALRYRLFDEGVPAAAATAATKSLLLWGGIGADTIPFLEPVFVVSAPPALPDSVGEYRASRTHVRWWPTLLAQLHNARGGRWRRQFQLCLRPAGAVRMGRESGENHPHRPWGVVHLGPGKRHSDGHCAQPFDWAGAGHPARPVTCDPGGCGCWGHRHSGSRDPLQPRNPGRGRLETMREHAAVARTARGFPPFGPRSLLFRHGRIRCKADGRNGRSCSPRLMAQLRGFPVRDLRPSLRDPARIRAEGLPGTVGKRPAAQEGASFGGWARVDRLVSRLLGECLHHQNPIRRPQQQTVASLQAA